MITHGERVVMSLALIAARRYTPTAAAAADSFYFPSFHYRWYLVHVMFVGAQLSGTLRHTHCRLLLNVDSRAFVSFALLLLAHLSDMDVLFC